MTKVARTLEREIDLIARFLQLLQREQDALKKGAPSELPQLSEAKNELVGQLNDIEAERDCLVGNSDGVLGRNAMVRWLKENPAATQCQTLWEKLLQLAQEAKQLHELNGQLLALHLRKTNEALTILARRNQENTIYGSNGQAFSVTGSRIVDSA